LEGRIGLIVPSSSTIMEVDYSRLAPEGISIHTSRIHFKGASSTEELTALLKHVNDAVKLLVDCRPNVIVWGCTAASIVAGLKKG
jgi:maleate isomerase